MNPILRNFFPQYIATAEGPIQCRLNMTGLDISSALKHNLNKPLEVNFDKLRNGLLPEEVFGRTPLSVFDNNYENQLDSLSKQYFNVSIEEDVNWGNVLKVDFNTYPKIKQGFEIMMRDPAYKKFFLSIIKEKLDVVYDFLFSLNQIDDFENKFRYWNQLFSKNKIMNWILLFGYDVFILLDEFLFYENDLKVCTDSIGNIPWKNLFEKVIIELQIHEVAAVHAAQSLLKYTSLPKDWFVISYNEDIFKEEYFDVFREEFDLTKKQIYLLDELDVDVDLFKMHCGFADYYNHAYSANLMAKSVEKIDKDKRTFTLPYRALKLNVLRKANAEISKRYLGVAETRPVIVVSSPRSEHLEYLVKSYKENFTDIPKEERPLLVLGMRTQWKKVLDYCLAYGLDYVIRTSRDQDANKDSDVMFAEGNPIANKDVIVLYTMGELASLYSVADLAIVDYNRNLLEPTAYGVPTLYFDDGTWTVNEVAKFILNEEDSIKAIDKKKIGYQLLQILYNQKGSILKQNSEQAYNKLDQEVLKDSVEFVDLFFALFLLKLKNQQAEK